MATTKDEEVNRLRQQEHILMRKYDRGDINEEEYNVQLKVIREKINERNNICLKKSKEEIIKDNEVNKMVEEKTEKVKGTKIGTKPKKNSMASIVADALMKKSFKNYDAVADKVLEVKPDADKKKIIGVAKIIIRECKKEKGRWKAYTWSDENFLLTPKE